jgi:hypothetical protein
MPTTPRNCSSSDSHSMAGWLPAWDLEMGRIGAWRRLNLETGREGRIVAWGLGNGDLLALASRTGAGHCTAADDGGGGGGSTRRWSGRARGYLGGGVEGAAAKIAEA